MNISEKARNIVDNCRFCWMCRHVCPIGNATGQERNTARARALAVSMAARGAVGEADIVGNIYECSLCGACTNNCVTGFDPKVFIQEVKTECVLNGIIPEYIRVLLDRYTQTGNVYGLPFPDDLRALYGTKKTDTLFIAGQDAVFKSGRSVKNAANLLKKSGISFTMEEAAEDTGAALWFLTGRTEDTREAAFRCAEIMKGYKTVIVYDPVDLKLMRHEYREWGIPAETEVLGFNEYILRLIGGGKLRVKNGGREYTPQDSYAYARDLDDTETFRKLICAVGKNREMLLHGKEADLAGSLLMNEYMPDVMKKTAQKRFDEAVAAGCGTLVTENPAEYELLKAVCPEGCRVLSAEEMILENMR